MMLIQLKYLITGVVIIELFILPNQIKQLVINFMFGLEVIQMIDYLILGQGKLVQLLKFGQVILKMILMQKFKENLVLIQDILIHLPININLV